ncbi:MAG: R3H domain-containing nucleic acid-binding protein [Salegentibacter mishustinae]|nr:R3H domain-containing nucleic acid-binding protein [Salegentibacter mishustinae]
MSENQQKFIDSLTSLTKDIMGRIGIEGEVNVLEDKDNNHCMVVSVSTNDDVEDLMHKNGNGIRSIEHILRLVVSQNFNREDHVNFILDINDYRKTKTNHLVKLAKETAERVRTSKRAEALSPMSSYERRLVHLELAAYSDLSTESIGEDPKRRIVIKPL